MSTCNKAYQECCLYFTANSLSRLITTMADESFRITGLSPSYGHLMLTLIEQPGLSQNELSHIMNLQPSTMTRFIDKLILLEYVERVQQGRSAIIHPTEKGLALRPLIDKALANLYNKYCEILGKEFAIKLTSEIYKASEILREKKYAPKKR